jgi:hypothetical protein
MKFPKIRSGARNVALCVAITIAAQAQVTDVHLPDANAGNGLVCNMVPFSSVFGAPAGSWTHLVIVPAASLASQGVLPGDKLVDIRFAPCGDGVITMPDVQIVVGHLVAPLPTFSLINGFADQTLVYDSTTEGALTFPCVANTWSSLRVGGGNLAWNGMDDVGIYTTHQGLTIASETGWQGSFWRDAALMRHYVNSYQGSMALTASMSGLKLGLTFANPATVPAARIQYGQGTAGSFGVPVFDAPEAPSFGSDTFSLGVSQAFPGAVAVLLISSVAVDVPIGVGADVRLLADVSPAATSFLVPMPVNAFGAAGVPAPIPQYSMGLAGLTVYCQWAIIGDPMAPMTILGLPLAMTDGLLVSLGV